MCPSEPVRRPDMTPVDRAREALTPAEYGAVEQMAFAFVQARTGWTKERLALASPSSVLATAFAEAMRT